MMQVDACNVEGNDTEYVKCERKAIFSDCHNDYLNHPKNAHYHLMNGWQTFCPGLVNI